MKVLRLEGDHLSTVRQYADHLIDEWSQIHAQFQALFQLDVPKRILEALRGHHSSGIGCDCEWTQLSANGHLTLSC